MQKIVNNLAMNFADEINRLVKRFEEKVSTCPAYRSIIDECREEVRVSPNRLAYNEYTREKYAQLFIDIDCHSGLRKMFFHKYFSDVDMVWIYNRK